jgi:SWI/SNF-related matrix-associated actin-dependent regulator of chromatin subfamily A3
MKAEVHTTLNLSHGCEFQLPATLGRNGQLEVAGGLHAGYLDSQSAEVIKVLSEDSTIETQILISPPAIPLSGKRSQGSSRRPCPVSVIIYGPVEMFDDIGVFFQECGLYLQDPIACDRNVPYCNPHRLSVPDDQIQLTFDLMQSRSDSSMRQLHKSDSLDGLIIPRELPELETPHLLRTQLLPYFLPVLRLLTLMLILAKAPEASTIFHDPTGARMGLH